MSKTNTPEMHSTQSGSEPVVLNGSESLIECLK